MNTENKGPYTVKHWDQYKYSDWWVPIGPSKTPNIPSSREEATIMSDCLNAAYLAGQQSQPPAPSVLLPFSESEIERMMNKASTDISHDGKSLITIHNLRAVAEAVVLNALRYANTKAVSIDKIMEAFKEELREHDGGAVIGWILDEDNPLIVGNLHERLSRL